MLPLGVIALGLVQGSLAGLNSLGLVLLWRTTRLVNLAQPAMGLVGGTLTGVLVTAGKWSFWWAAPVGLLIGVLLGLIAERVVVRRLRDAPRTVLLVATVGLAQMFGAMSVALPFIFGGELPTYSISLGFTIRLDPVVLFGPHLLALLALPLATVATHHFLTRNRFGIAACGLGQDAERARALGVPADVVRSVVWVVAGFLATISGMLAIPVLGFNLGGAISPLLLLFAIAPAVIAGFRSVWGAAIAALALGVAYRACIWYTDQAGLADLLLVAVVIAAIALQRRKLGREDAAGRASSWEAASTPRPLPAAARSAPAVRAVGIALGVVALCVAIAAPWFLEADQRVTYSFSAALAVAALGVAVAWMFAGEIALGHWGFAGLGAAVASFTPGPWPVRALVATLVLTSVGAAAALATRRQGSLAFAVLGLCAAAAAPVAILKLGQHVLEVDVAIVGSVGAGLAVAITAGMSWLRRSGAGLRMVATRDDPQRAPWLGADPLRSRVLALAISTGLAGLAGGLYLATINVGIAPRAFELSRSLDLLAMAVVGGLGSPVGALAGAVLIQCARIFLAPPWDSIVSGGGIMLVVIFAPAGLARSLNAVRDFVVARLVPATPPAPHAPPVEREAVRV